MSIDNKAAQEAFNTATSASAKTPITDKQGTVKGQPEEKTATTMLDSVPVSSSVSIDKIGPRAIPGLVLQDVEAKGNCFYDAVIHQMRLMGHAFLTEVPPGTSPRDSLRLRIQGRAFKDGEWADHAEIIALARTFDVIVAVVDTRDPTERFVCHYINVDNHPDSTPDIAQLSPRPTIRLAFTGNHYLSVVRTATEAKTEAKKPPKISPAASTPLPTSFDAPQLTDKKGKRSSFSSVKPKGNKSKLGLFFNQLQELNENLKRSKASPEKRVKGLIKFVKETNLADTGEDATYLWDALDLDLQTDDPAKIKESASIFAHIINYLLADCSLNEQEIIKILAIRDSEGENFIHNLAKYGSKAEGILNYLFTKGFLILPLLQAKNKQDETPFCLAYARNNHSAAPEYYKYLLGGDDNLNKFKNRQMPSKKNGADTFGDFRRSYYKYKDQTDKAKKAGFKNALSTANIISGVLQIITAILGVLSLAGISEIGKYIVQILTMLIFTATIAAGINEAYKARKEYRNIKNELGVNEKDRSK